MSLKKKIAFSLLSFLIMSCQSNSEARSNLSSRNKENSNDSALRDEESQTKSKKLRRQPKLSLPNKNISDLTPPDATTLAMSRESSLHPEHDTHSPSYSGRSAPGPEHGEGTHGDEPHDEVPDNDLPANKGIDTKHPYGEYYPTKDPYAGTLPR